MLNLKVKAFVWNMIAVFSVLLGVLGSMSAWESGNITFIRMIVQAAFFGVFAYAAASTAAAAKRALYAARRRRSHNVVKHPAVAASRPALHAA